MSKNSNAYNPTGEFYQEMSLFIEENDIREKALKK